MNFQDSQLNQNEFISDTNRRFCKSTFSEDFNIQETLLKPTRRFAKVRERQRTENVNEAFEKLKNVVPTLPSDKLSKIQTIKLATYYIRFLYSTLNISQIDQTSVFTNGLPKENIRRVKKMKISYENINNLDIYNVK